MINQQISNIVTWLIKHNAITEEDKELYEYAIFNLLITICPFFITLIIGFMMGVPAESIALLFPFMLIRKFSGGYHARTPFTCFLYSTMIIFIMVFIASKTNNSLILKILLTVSSISLAYFSPVDSENRRLNPNECIRYKYVTITIVAMFIIIYMLLTTDMQYA